MPLSLNGTGEIGGITTPLSVAQGGTGASDALAARSALGLAGTVLQVVHFDTGALATGTIPTPIDDTIPQNTEGDQYMSLAITPKSATSILRIDVVGLVAPSAALWVVSALFRDATANSVGAISTYVNQANVIIPGAYSVKVPSGSTTTTTFRVRIGQDSAGTLTFNGSAGARHLGGVMASSIRITEIAA